MIYILNIIAMIVGGAVLGAVATLGGSAGWLVVALTIAGSVLGCALLWLAIAFGWIR